MRTVCVEALLDPVIDDKAECDSRGSIASILVVFETRRELSVCLDLDVFFGAQLHHLAVRSPDQIKKRTLKARSLTSRIV